MILIPTQILIRILNDENWFTSIFLCIFHVFSMLTFNEIVCNYQKVYIGSLKGFLYKR